MYSLFVEELQNNDLSISEKDFFLIDISLENLVDDITKDGFNIEEAYWKDPNH